MTSPNEINSPEPTTVVIRKLTREEAAAAAKRTRDVWFKIAEEMGLDIFWFDEKDKS